MALKPVTVSNAVTLSVLPSGVENAKNLMNAFFGSM